MKSLARRRNLRRLALKAMHEGNTKRAKQFLRMAQMNYFDMSDDEFMDSISNSPEAQSGGQLDRNRMFNDMMPQQDLNEEGLPAYDIENMSEAEIQEVQNTVRAKINEARLAIEALAAYVWHVPYQIRPEEFHESISDLTQYMDGYNEGVQDGRY